MRQTETWLICNATSTAQDPSSVKYANLGMAAG